MSDDDLLRIRVDLLKTELSILDSKIKSIVDRLWQIRALCQALWVGLVAIGLGAGTGDRIPVPELLWVSTVVPLWSAYVDASYQRWYRRFRMREDAIRRLFATPAEAEGGEGWVRALAGGFPLLDLDGRVTYGNDREYRWSGSRWSGLFDTTPVLTFGSLASLSLVLSYLAPVRGVPWWILPFGLLIATLSLYGAAGLARRHIAREGGPTTG